MASSSSPPLSLQSFDYCEDSPSRKGVLVALDDDENEDESESPKECSSEDRNMAVVAYDHNKRAVVPYRTDNLSVVPYVASTPLQRFCIPTTTKVIFHIIFNFIVIVLILDIQDGDRFTYTEDMCELIIS